MVPLKDFFERLSLPPERVREQELLGWMAQIPDVMPISETEPRTRCRVAGVVRNIRINPQEGRSVEATITDGTGELTIRWLGRSSLQGVRLGIGIIAEGTRGDGSEGHAVILNPEYHLTPGPEHG
jgi:hypothetical protein